MNGVEEAGGVGPKKIAMRISLPWKRILGWSSGEALRPTYKKLYQRSPPGTLENKLK